MVGTRRCQPERVPNSRGTDRNRGRAPNKGHRGDDGDSRQVRRTGGGALSPMVVEAIGWSEFGNNGGVGEFGQGYAWGGQKMRAYGHKIGTTSRRSGSTSRSFPRVELPTSRRDRDLVFHGSDVEIQRRDVTERVKLKNFQHFSKF